MTETYILVAEMKGFKRFVQERILVQQRSDVTVDIKMETGAITESITVGESRASATRATSP